MIDEPILDNARKGREDASKRGKLNASDEPCKDDPERSDVVCRELFPLSKSLPTGQSADITPDLSQGASTTPCERPLIGSAPTSFASGKLGKFEVVEVLGEGGQGSAVLAVDPDLKRRVVVKQYHVTEQANDREMLLSEGRALARVESPYVARCLAVERADRECYLVVEYVPGTTLKARQETQPLSFVEAARVVEQVASGVAAIHTAGLLHRDIKPANIILGEDGVPKLVDFGLATPVASDSLHQVAGTVAYMAPEQARGEGERIDPRTDVFALGAVLYYLLTGQSPYRARSLSEVFEQAKQAKYERPRSLNAKAPRPLERICLKAMAASPKGRYASASDLAHALRGYRRRPLLFASVATAVVALVCLLSLVAWASRQRDRSFLAVNPAREGGNSPTVTAAEQLDGDLILSLWSTDGNKRGLHVDETGALPARAGDMVHLEARLNQPGYIYLMWVSGQGELYLLHPWRKGTNGPVPAARAENLTILVGSYGSVVPTDVLHEPPQYNRGLEMAGESGLETAILLARSTPLPADTPLGDLLNDLPVSPLRDPGEWAILDLHSRVHMGRHRGLNTDQTKEIDDPLLRLMERLRPHFEVTRAVRFAYAGE
jgi:serine/threonine protein kinase